MYYTTRDFGLHTSVTMRSTLRGRQILLRRQPFGVALHPAFSLSDVPGAQMVPLHPYSRGNNKRILAGSTRYPNDWKKFTASRRKYQSFPRELAGRGIRTARPLDYYGRRELQFGSQKSTLSMDLPSDDFRITAVAFRATVPPSRAPGATGPAACRRDFFSGTSFHDGVIG